MTREELKEKVFQDLILDFEQGDYTVLFELLGYIDDEILLGSLREVENDNN